MFNKPGPVTAETGTADTIASTYLSVDDNKQSGGLCLSGISGRVQVVEETIGCGRHLASSACYGSIISEYELLKPSKTCG